ncbi:MAG: ATP synthase subunit I [Vulcanimicrobiota bacterium]
MNLWIKISISIIGGSLLAMIYFGLLWKTVSELPNSRNPGLLTLGSFVFRMILVLAGFYFLSLLGWHHVITSLASFTLMRFLSVNKIYHKNCDKPVLE